MFVDDENEREVGPTCRLGRQFQDTVSKGHNPSNGVTTTRLATYKLLGYILVLVQHGGKCQGEFYG